MRKIFNQTTIVFIMMYQFLSQFKHLIFLNLFGITSYCKHQPSCSQYCLEQVKLHGTITGLNRGIHRLASCHPGSPHSNKYA